MRKIAVSPHVCFGKPVLEGTRIPVYMVLDLVEEGCSFEEIVRDFYPDLTVSDVQACVRYANEIVKNEEVHVGVGVAE